MTEPKSRANSSSAITSVRILPEKPTKETDLSVTIQGKNPDDRITYTYQWIKNGGEILGTKENILKRDNFKKGDLILCKVTPFDGKAEGKPILSPEVKILNSPPVIQKVWIEPRPAYVTTENLRAHVKAYDADGDSIYYDYRWERKGETISGNRSEILERVQFEKGDVIRVFVTPDDREALGRTEDADTYVK